MKINSVKFKDKQSFEKNKTKSNVKAVYEPFGIIVFEDQNEVTPDASKVSQVNQIDAGIDTIPSGLAICIASNFKEAVKYLNDMKVEITETFEQTSTIFVSLPSFSVFDEFYQAMMSSKLFISVEPDMIQAFQSNEEMSIPAQWHLQNLKAQEAWSLIPDGAYGEVAVLDIACEVDHEDLVGTISDKSWNCAYDIPDVRPISEYEKHGTCCSGLICAATGNNIGVSSIGNNKLKVQFLHIGMNSTSGGSFMTSDTIVTRAVNKAIENPNCIAISMSWGGTNVYTMFANALTLAKNTGRGGKGIAIFASSGNQYSSTVGINPAAMSMVNAVGASTTNNTRAVFSNYGTKLFAAAPGTSCPTVDRTGASGYNATSNYTNFSGTSAACPVMAGCAAMVGLANPALTESQIVEIIKNTARKSGGYVYDASGKSLELGYGVVDLYAAVTEAKNGGIIPPPPPSEAFNLFGTISSPASANQGATVNLVYTVQLDKAITKDVATNVQIQFVRPDGATSIFYTGSVMIPAGQTMTTYNVNYTLPNNTTGVGTFNFAIDPQSVISETNELDNVSSTSIQINAVAPVGQYDISLEPTGYTWLDAGRVRIGTRLTNRGTTTITSYKLTWEFGTQRGTWNVTRTLAPGGVVSTGNVMYPRTTDVFPLTFKVSVVSVNELPDSNPTNDVATTIVQRP